MRTLSSYKMPRLSKALDRRKTIHLLLCLCILYTFHVYNYSSCDSYFNETLFEELLLLQESNQSHHCVLPTLDPWDASIQAYLKPPYHLHCRYMQPYLTYVDRENVLRINKTTVLREKLSPKCKYRCFKRPEAVDDVSLIHDEWRELNDFVRLRCEFVEVTCTGHVPYLPIYTYVHATIVRRDEEMYRDGPSVVVMLFDSLSRSNFRRYMPRTEEVLKNVYNAKIFDGLVKVGDNSLPNAAALFAGKRTQTAGQESELPDDMSHTFMDDWPLIWKHFQAKHCITFYAEDNPDFNVFFYLAKGFQKQPTHHYLRPYWLKVHPSILHRRSTSLCYANTPMHQLQLDYLDRFLNNYKASTCKFALNWLTDVGHDWLHYIAVADNDTATFLLRNKEHLARSWLIITGDHGHRFDAIRQTVLGRLEERTPLFAIAPPKDVLNNENLMKNLDDNSHVRTMTPKTYKQNLGNDIVHDDLNTQLPIGRYSKRGERTKSQSSHNLSYSFLRPISNERNCEDAGIPTEFCICQREIAINDSHALVQRAAQAIVTRVNSILEPVKDKCARLHLHTTLNAQLFLPSQNLLTSQSTFARGLSHLADFMSGSSYTLSIEQFHLRVTVNTNPDKGVYEGTIEYNRATDTLNVLGDVNRINRYGNTTYCMHTQLLRKYCYCL